jgi:hypothetical protein
LRSDRPGVLSYAQLISCVHDFSRGIPTVAVFRAYLDDSANTEDTFFIVGGFVGHDKAWRSLEPKWKDALPSCLEYFHTADCFTGSGQFKEKNIDIPERVRLLDTLTDLITKHDIRLIACGLPTKKYANLAPKKKSNDFWRNRYVAVFGDAVRLACEYAVSPAPLDVSNKSAHVCHLWWEDGEYCFGAREFIKDAKRNSTFWWRTAIGTDTYGDKEGPAKIELLQVADFGAFFGSKKIANSSAGTIPWEPYYKRLDEAGKILKIIAVTEVELDIFYNEHLGC